MFIPIKAYNISDYENIISEEDGFVKRIDNERGIIAYDSGVFSHPGKYPEINSETPEHLVRNYLLRRDLRGIKFSLKTGNIICRPWHKFFNVGEREETFFNKIDMSQPHELYDKLDGSMISSLVADDGNLYYTSKKGVTAICGPVHEYVRLSNYDYNGFCLELINKGFTPIFEWCSRKQRIVLDYPVDKLIVTSVRSMQGGYYLKLEEISDIANHFNVPYAKPENINITNIKELCDYTEKLIGLEGFVLRIGDDRFKIKAEEYRRIHKTLEGIVFEKDIISLICNNTLDDVIPHLSLDIASIVKSYEEKVIKNIVEESKNLINMTLDVYGRFPNKKDFALYIANFPSEKKPFMFHIYEIIKNNNTHTIIDDVVNILKNRIISKCSRASTIEQMRWIFKENWNDYYYSTNE